jgi:hypothetical protein
MEPESSLPCSQKLSIGPNPEPAESISPGRAKESVKVRGVFKHFVSYYFFKVGGLLAPRPTPELKDHPL